MIVTWRQVVLVVVVVVVVVQLRGQQNMTKSSTSQAIPAVFRRKHAPGKFECLSSAHVGDTKWTAARQTAYSSLAHLDEKIGQCKADCGSALHTGIQREHSPGEVRTHHHVYSGSVTPIYSNMLTGNDEEELCDTLLHESYRSVLGVAVWTVFTWVELAAYVQALQRRAHAPRIKDCERLNLAIRCMKRQVRP